MKKFSFLPVIALMIAFAASAFTTSTKDVTSTNQLWYEFTGGDPNVATDYEIMGTGTVEPECETGSERCAVKASAHPELGATYPNLDDEQIDIRDKN